MEKKTEMIEAYNKLSVTEQQAIRQAFNKHIFEIGMCSSVTGVEDDYDYRSGEYNVYKDQFRLWLGSYFYFHKHSLERLLERTKVVLTTRDREHKEVPLGVTVDRFGFCYGLRIADDVPLRSFDLKELKEQWDTTLKLNEGI